MNSNLQLEERTCACGCGKTFRCLPTSQTRYSSLHCMEAAGALPPAESLTRGGKAARSSGVSARTDEGDEADPESDAESDSDDAQALLLDVEEEEDDGIPPAPEGGSVRKSPPEIDPAA